MHEDAATSLHVPARHTAHATFESDETFPPSHGRHDAPPGVTIMPEDGDMLMWEGMVRHEVIAKEFKNPRYVIAGNMFFEYRKVTEEYRLQHHTEANTSNRKDMAASQFEKSKAKSVYSTSEME